MGAWIVCRFKMGGGGGTWQEREGGNLESVS